MNNQIENNKQAKDPTQDQTTNIPVEQIHGNLEQNTGIRDQERFELLKQNIASIGLTNPVIVRRENGGYELIAGHHRIEVAKQLGWTTILARIKHVDANESAEMCLADNLLHSEYKPEQKEAMIYRRWKNGNYPTKEELGRKIGVSGVWINKLIEAYELRNELKEKHPKLILDDFSSQTLLEAKKILEKPILKGNGDLIRFLEIALAKKYKPSKISEVVTALNQWDTKWRNMVLYEDVSYDKARMMMQEETKKSTPKQEQSKKVTVETIKRNFVEDTYKKLDKNLSNAIGCIEDKDDKITSLRYAKMTMALYAEVLHNYQQITKDQLKQIKEDILGIKIPANNYDGDPDVQKLAAFYDTTNNPKVTSENDPPASQDEP